MSEPLSMIKRGKAVYVRYIDGSDSCKKHLEEMGFLPGTPLVVSRICDGPLVVAVRGSKLILGQKLAQKIMVDPFLN